MTRQRSRRQPDGQQPVLFSISTDEEHPTAGPHGEHQPVHPRRPTEAPTVLPPTLDVVTAARLLGIGRTLAYRLVRNGEWPTPVLKLGTAIRIPTQQLLQLISSAPADPQPAPRDGANRRFQSRIGARGG